MSEFHPDNFLDTEMDDALEDVYTPIPEADYMALVDDIKMRTTKADQQILDVTYDILDEDLKTKMDTEKVIVRQSLFLDIDNGVLALGSNKNIKLGKLRAALGQNVQGKPWSPRLMKGAGPIKIHVTQRPDKDDPEIVYNDVSKVVAA